MSNFLKDGPILVAFDLCRQGFVGPDDLLEVAPAVLERILSELGITPKGFYG